MRVNHDATCSGGELDNMASDLRSGLRGRPRFRRKDMFALGFVAVGDRADVTIPETQDIEIGFVGPEARQRRDRHPQQLAEA